MLGVNATTDSVSRLEKVAWRRTLGWKVEKVSKFRRLQGFKDLETLKRETLKPVSSQTRPGGVVSISWRGRYLTTE
jgi:hypothetical protein